MDGKKISELGFFWHDADVRRRRVFILIAGFILVVIGLVAFWPGGREPQYQGKKLSEWIDIAGSNLSGPDLAILGESGNFNTISNVLALEAVRAVRSIGSNALPCLVSWIAYERPAWREKALRVYEILPARLQSNKVENWIFGTGETRRTLAILGFVILQRDAGPAVPGLVRIVEDSKSQRCQYDALVCLRMVGAAARPAVPHLKELASKTVGALSNSAGEIRLTVEVIEAGGMFQFMTNTSRPFQQQ
jgi:hypothetical protein